MAVEVWKNFWPPGRGLVDMNKLNRLFTGAQQAQAINVSGGATIAGGMILSGGVTVAGQRNYNQATVIATGNSVANARTVGTTSSVIVVNSSTSAEGVKLPTPVTGLAVTILTPLTVGVTVYASAAGQSIGTGTTNTTGNVAVKNAATTYYAISKTKWRV